MHNKHTTLTVMKHWEKKSRIINATSFNQILPHVKIDRTKISNLLDLNQELKQIFYELLLIALRRNENFQDILVSKDTGKSKQTNLTKK